MAATIQLRRGLASEWYEFDPILKMGEIAYEIDTYSYKIGDGDTSWRSLRYSGGHLAAPETYALSDLDIMNKKIELSAVPLVPERVTLLPANGIPQINGIDFKVQGKTLYWNDLGLDNFLEDGDILFISY